MSKFRGWTKPVAPPVEGMTPGGLPMRPPKNFPGSENVARPAGPPPKPSDLRDSPQNEMYKSITRMANAISKVLEKEV